MNIKKVRDSIKRLGWSNNKILLMLIHIIEWEDEKKKIRKSGQ